jgi:uncharacterized protein YbjT (DUF2867 family)
MTKVFVAGVSGFTGRALLALPEASRLDLVLHLRPGSSNLGSFEQDPRTKVAAFDDVDALADAMSGCQSILSMVGIVRAKFGPGVSYETVDYGTTVALAEAGKKAGIEHFVLMSSMGADLPLGPYLKWKRKAEKAVIDSGIPYTIVRPSYLVGQERRPIPGMTGLMNGLGKLFFIRKVMDDWRQIPIEVVAWNYVRILSAGSDKNTILTGRDLWGAYGNNS